MLISSHPDAQARFVELSNAYEVLIDPELRVVYDETGEEGLKIATAIEGELPRKWRRVGLSSSPSRGNRGREMREVQLQQDQGQPILLKMAKVCYQSSTSK